MSRKKSRVAAFTLIELMIVIAIIAIIAAIAIPNLMAARKHANETAAVGALKTLQNAEAMFRDGDRTGNGTPIYATRGTLRNYQYIDAVLGSGTKQGYYFQVLPSAVTPEFLWFGMANPAVPGSTGDRYFETNEHGVIFYTTTTAATLTTQAAGDCSIEAGFLPVGK
jgi:type IV pilus assembly protein PilA